MRLRKRYVMPTGSVWINLVVKEIVSSRRNERDANATTKPIRLRYIFYSLGWGYSVSGSISNSSSKRGKIIHPPPSAILARHQGERINKKIIKK